VRDRRFWPLDRTYEEAFAEATQDDFDRLWRRIAVGAPDDCWPWKNRYGAPIEPHEAPKIYIQRKEWRAPRFLMMSMDEEVPADSQVFHVCGNLSCCNPAHLRVGSNNDRVRAVHARGGFASGTRSGHYTHPEATPRGEVHGSAKLTESQVKEILQEFSKGDVTLADLGRRYGVNYRTIGVLVRGETWKHLGSP
jgi:hypothetical protein